VLQTTKYVFIKVVIVNVHDTTIQITVIPDMAIESGFQTWLAKSACCIKFPHLFSVLTYLFEQGTVSKYTITYLVFHHNLLITELHHIGYKIILTAYMVQKIGYFQRIPSSTPHSVATPHLAV
jgi:hypothetical protein